MGELTFSGLIIRKENESHGRMSFTHVRALVSVSVAPESVPLAEISSFVYSRGIFVMEFK
jgi:hypothetical protein